MEILTKILIAPITLGFFITIIKAFSYNGFDKLFVPKHQKIIYNLFLFMSLLLLFFIISVVYSFLLEDLGVVVSPNIIGWIVWFYLVYILLLIAIVISKVISKRIAEKYTTSSAIKPFILIGCFMNYFFLSIKFNEIVYLKYSSMPLMQLINNIFNISVVFLVITYVFIYLGLWLSGDTKRKWAYILSPVIDDVEDKHLYVLYSLSSTTLVLSEDTKNSNNPTTVYLYDMSKNSYICFKKVLNLDYSRKN